MLLSRGLLGLAKSSSSAAKGDLARNKGL